MFTFHIEVILMTTSSVFRGLSMLLPNGNLQSNWGLASKLRLSKKYE